MTRFGPKLKSTRRLVGLTVALLLTLGAVAALDVRAGVPVPIDAENNGPWRYASITPLCPGTNKVCAEWPDFNAEVATICCIDLATLGSYAYDSSDCLTLLGERPL